MSNTPHIPPEGPDLLEARLRESNAPIPDDGFTARVVSSLPPRRRFDLLRWALFAVAWLAGAGILLFHAPAKVGTVATFLQHARVGEFAPLLALAPVVFAAGCLVWALTSWALEE
jgi:hypothetical protein